MQYLIIDTRTNDGKVILELIKKNKSVKLLNLPNEDTKKALREAKQKTNLKEIKNTNSWLNSLFKTQ